VGRALKDHADAGMGCDAERAYLTRSQSATLSC
jgi:hypothetical protein